MVKGLLLLLGCLMALTACQAAPAQACQTVYCFVEPCLVANCPNHPNAVCTNDYCGACRAVYTLPDGTLVTDCHGPKAAANN
ncbi:uncharacterized protein LOC143278121 [Babylonia areolata]|uniref:uncharacterized protein LOC143278121 n=1 Tax=Babylonia areolata TaxID=304850 RepID=UPI003FD58053